MVRITYKSNHRLLESTPRIFKFKEWYSFSDMDNFNSDHLISILTTHDVNGIPFLWSSLTTSDMDLLEPAGLLARKQAEAIFNLSQLMFALYHGSFTACTFCDLQLNKLPRDIRQNGFTKLRNYVSYTGTIFRKALHSLCWDIAESGGLPVIFSMMKNPFLPIIRQKCLDALTNILCVDNIEKIVLDKQPWFLEVLISMVELGDLQCDMVPAISVLDRLVVVILSEKMKDPYSQLIKRNFVNICLNRLKSPEFTSKSVYLHFVKFQTISMQAIALLCADKQSKSWPKLLQDDIFAYAYKSILMWNTDSPPTDPVWHQSESFYRTMSFSSSALLFSFVILVHAILEWSDKADFLQKQNSIFKYQLSRLMTSQGYSSNNDDVNYLVISNCVSWIWNKLYSDNKSSEKRRPEKLFPSILDPLPELCEKVLRKCSNKECQNVERSVGQWKVCENCNFTCYCSPECQRSHQATNHSKKFCDFLAMQYKGFDVIVNDSKKVFSKS